MRRIMYINSICGSGSTGRIITGLMDRLTDMGIETLAAYGRGTAPLEYDTYRIGTKPGVLLHGGISRLTDRHGLYSTGATRRLIEVIRRFNPDLIHIHNVHGYYVNYALLFHYLREEFVRIRKKPRLVWTLHDCWAFTGHCTHYSYIGCDKWLTGCDRCPQKNQYPKSFLGDASEENYRLKKKLFPGIRGLSLVTPSEWLKTQVEKSFLRDYPISVVPTGIDVSVFQETPSDLRERFGVGNRLLLLGVANPWRERKGYDDFLRLAEILGDGCRIAMIGLKRRQMKNLPANIIAIGHTDSLTEMVQWYSCADIYVNLTLEDTFPTTNLEAMACGTPVLTYDAGGSGESVTEETGKVVACGDLKAVIRAIQEIMQRDREALRLACRTRALDYTADRRFRQYIKEIYGIG
ncbi:MAG: glycosyltransferase [Lachnospiraceae bacterium]|nr:glycosyltransferase [Lachnospiraceae bacterium]